MSQLVYQIVTDRILAALDAGTVPWRKPWTVSIDALGNRTLNSPRNLVSGKAYRGCNLFLLGTAPFACPWWLTFKQALGRGGSVRKGERGTPVIFWKRSDYTKKGTNGGEDEKRTGLLLRYYTVFNATQCDGVEYPQQAAPVVAEPVAPAAPSLATIPEAEAIIARMPNLPTMIDGRGRAYYSPSLDVVGMPERSSFNGAAEWYSTLFHELTHSTAHKSRVGRVLGEGFGTDDYAKEELVAEMGAGYLCALSGIIDATIDNSAAYIAGWRKRIKDDPKIVVHAAGHAQRAAEYIAGKAAAAEPAEAPAETAAA